MPVKVKYHLARGRMVVLHDIEAVGACFFSHRPGHLPQGAEQRFTHTVRNFKEVGPVPLRYDQGMAPAYRVYVHEGQDVVVLIDLGTWNLAGDHFAEQAFRVDRAGRLG